MKDQEKDSQIAKAEFLRYLQSDLWFPQGLPTEETFEAYKALSLPNAATERLLVWLQDHPTDWDKMKLPEVSEEELRVWFAPNPGDHIKRLVDALVRELQVIWSASRLRPELALDVAAISDKDRLDALVSSACKDVSQLAQAQGKTGEAEHVCGLLQEATQNAVADGGKSEALQKAEEALAIMSKWSRKDDATFSERLKSASALIISLQKVLEEQHEL